MTERDLEETRAVLDWSRVHFNGYARYPGRDPDNRSQDCPSPHRHISLTMLDVIIIYLSRIQSYFVSTVAASVMNLDSRGKAKG